MPLQPERLQYLLQQYFTDRISREELEELYTAIPGASDEELQTLLDEQFGGMDADESVREVDWDRMFHRIVTPPQEIRRRPFFNIQYAAAAMLLLALGAGIMYWCLERRAPAPVTAGNTTSTHDAAPGSNKAILTLGDGSQVTLDSTGHQVLQQGGTAVHQQGGSLAYKSENAAAPVTYNTLTTPRGGQFQVALPDGTLVWLNAASSLKYPTAFTGDVREVVLKGEAYFEVAHNAKQPFRVQVNGLEIKDLGTRFNVMAYEDEAAVRTTLVDGAVQVNSAHHEARLKPGEEAVLETSPPGGGLGQEAILVRPADLEVALAWKNGEFAFRHTSLHEIMRQVSRWYDVDINYKDDLNIYLSGNISKNVNVSEVFKMLQLAGNVHFSVDQKTATVMK
ncbi:iron dicitrate transport regulator FecR [Chitinophaga parva]|uniref:Iron dicitrate transport regulator FecR n=1 Tax=Chitinophaga parva TaxID=2169414 RepID=A0A2T7BFL0_9BACT|nr:FecR family protein [Chitinophaga parva]PUZ25072.1 iron dicitrate transport regulator FecR [Chitinophaga parva]